ncbi:MAG: hypothetical protein IT170_16465 [Bryobacterales bacterium]|nr:hypothetical protein [Bryobacterales bacterium]
MTRRAKGWLGCFAIMLALMGLAGCAKKRQRVPVPVAPPSAPPSTSVPDVGRPGPPGIQPSAALMPPPGCVAGPKAPWLDCRYESASGETLRYYLALPATGGGELLPIVTVLHGSSGSGPGAGSALNGSQRAAVDLWTSEDVQRRYPSIVVAPQAESPPGETWVRAWRAPASGDGRPKEALTLVMEVLGMLEARFPVDRRRLYLTGQSMGGFGAWLAYTRYPGYFAAIVPVCGGGDPGAVVANPTAVWAFHGDADTVVPVSRAREMVAAIEAAGGTVRYSEFAGMGHNIFAKAYSEPGLVEWLFRQRLPEQAGAGDRGSMGRGGTATSPSSRRR